MPHFYLPVFCVLIFHVRRKPENSDLLGDQLLGYRVYVRNLVCAGCEEGLGPITTMGRDSTEATVGLLSKFFSDTHTWYAVGVVRKGWG
jgi:hypothetical protein